MNVESLEERADHRVADHHGWDTKCDQLVRGQSGPLVVWGCLGIVRLIEMLGLEEVCYQPECGTIALIEYL